MAISEKSPPAPFKDALYREDSQPDNSYRISDSPAPTHIAAAGRRAKPAPPPDDPDDPFTPPQQAPQQDAIHQVERDAAPADEIAELVEQAVEQLDRLDLPPSASPTGGSQGLVPALLLPDPTAPPPPEPLSQDPGGSSFDDEISQLRAKSSSRQSQRPRTAASSRLASPSPSIQLDMARLSIPPPAQASGPAPPSQLTSAGGALPQASPRSARSLSNGPLLSSQPSQLLSQQGSESSLLSSQHQPQHPRQQQQQQPLPPSPLQQHPQQPLQELPSQPLSGPAEYSPTPASGIRTVIAELPRNNSSTRVASGQSPRDGSVNGNLLEGLARASAAASPAPPPPSYSPAPLSSRASSTQLYPSVPSAPAPAPVPLSTTPSGVPFGDDFASASELNGDDDLLNYEESEAAGPLAQEADEPMEEPSEAFPPFDSAGSVRAVGLRFEAGYASSEVSEAPPAAMYNMIQPVAFGVIPMAKVKMTCYDRTTGVQGGPRMTAFGFPNLVVRPLVTPLCLFEVPEQ